MNRLVTLLGVLLCSSALAFSGACAPGTMATYIGTSCSMGSLTFSNFSYSSGGSDPIPADGVSVAPVWGSEEGFDFNAPWTASASQSVDSVISYTVTGKISDLVLAIAGYGISGGGELSVAETTSDLPLSLLVFDNSSGLVPTETFTGLGLTKITVTKDIAVQGDGGTALLSGVDNLYSSSTPEPASLLLLGSGLLVLKRAKGIR